MTLTIDIRIKAALYEAFHNSKLAPKAIADKMNVSYNYLARAVIDGPSACNFPLHWLIPFLKITGKFLALKLIVNACGFLMVRKPRAFKNVEQIRISLREFQRQFLAAVDCLIDCLNNPTCKTSHAAIDALIIHQEETEYWIRMIKTKNYSQLELGI